VPWERCCRHLNETVLMDVFIICTTGHSTLIGEHTGKCLAYAVKCKQCRICAAAKMRDVPPRVHQCMNNWRGSAKSMEPAMACDMLRDIKNSGKRVSMKMCVISPHQYNCISDEVILISLQWLDVLVNLFHYKYNLWSETAWMNHIMEHFCGRCYIVTQ
jgi:hypothetical protein